MSATVAGSFQPPSGERQGLPSVEANDAVIDVAPCQHDPLIQAAASAIRDAHENQGGGQWPTVMPNVS
jgi:hypothetical protein